MKIVVLSRSEALYSTNRLIDEGEKKGHEMQVIDHTKCYMVNEKGKPAVFYNGEQITKVDAIIPRIGASVTFYGSAIIRQFELANVFTTLRSVALTRSRDKLRSLQILSRDGIPIPRTAIARSPNDIDNLIKQLGGTPLVIKLLEGTQGIGVVLAETKKAAKSVIEAFYGLNANILVQEFIEEAGGADIRAFVVNGEVVGAMKRQGIEGEFRSNLHRGGSAKIINLKPREKKLAINAAKSMGLNIAGVDMLPTKSGYYVLEVNSSPGLEGIEKATGVNIAGKIIDFVNKNASKKNKRDRIGT